MDRHAILEAVRQAAKANGGVPPGTHRLAQVGISPAVWRKYWARIGDMQRDAGLAPNQRQDRRPDSDVLAELVALTRELGHFPTSREIEVKRYSDRGFPSPMVFRRLGRKSRLAARLAEYARTNPGHEDIAALCAAHLGVDAEAAERLRPVPFGSVYLLKGPGRRYKIGRTNVFGRRRRELSIQLPFDTRKVHVIETDDPEGVEKYWHQRFETRRINSEWFELDANDVAAFKRWKRLR